VEVIEAESTGNKLKRLLKERGLTQEEFARRVGISFRHANRIILGDSGPSLVLAHRMAAVLSTSPDEIFGIRIKTRRRKARVAR
jgi:transcriptional regulator with XRE-family HTH domain